MTRLFFACLTLYLCIPLGVVNAQPVGYHLVFQDDFDALSLRSGGPTREGFSKGKGTWTPEDQEGFGYEWFVNRSSFSPFSVAHSILTISAGPMPPALASAYPSTTKGQPTHFGGAISTFDSFSIKPPFYLEAKMKLSNNPGAWAAFWTLGIDKGMGPPSDRYVKQWEDDIIESLGSSETYFASIHWNNRESNPQFSAPYLGKTFPVQSRMDLANTFNRYSSLVTKDETIWYFNGKEVRRIRHPPRSNANQPQFIILDLAFGFPWKRGVQYPDVPTSIGIDYVRAYAPDAR